MAIDLNPEAQQRLERYNHALLEEDGTVEHELADVYKRQLTYKCLSSSVVPYVLTYDASTGEVRGVGTAQQMTNFQPNEQMQMYFIRQFIKDARNIPLDPVTVSYTHLDVYKRQIVY